MTSLTTSSPFKSLLRIPMVLRVLLFAFFFTAAPLPMLSPVTAHAQGDLQHFGNVGGDEASQHFGNLQEKLKGFAVVVLLIMLVIAAMMAAMQKTGMAISIAIAAIILFGGVWILKLIQSGLSGGA